MMRFLPIFDHYFPSCIDLEAFLTITDIRSTEGDRIVRK